MASKLAPNNALTTRAIKWKKDQGIKSLTLDELLKVTQDKKIISEQKIDGQSAIMEYKNGQASFGSLSGRIITDIPVLHEIESLLKKKKISYALMVGELAGVERGKIILFDDTESLIKNPTKDKNALHWFPYQALKIDDKIYEEDFDSYLEGWEEVKSIFSGAKYVEPVKDSTDVEKSYKQYVEKEGNEGIVVRTSDDKVYKCKPTFTYDLVILAVGSKKGKNWPKRMIGNVLTAFMDKDGVFRVAGEIGTGWTDEEKRELFSWAHKNKVGEDDTYVWVKPQKIVEVEWERSNIMMYPSYTYERGKYVPQGKKPVGTIVKPRFIRYRTDKKVNPQDLRLTQIPNWEKTMKMARNIVSSCLYTAKEYILYHGTREDIKAEDLEERFPEYEGSLGKGIYFGQNEETAKYYGKNVLKVKAELRNPLIIDAGEGTNYRIEEEAQELIDTHGTFNSILVGERIPPFDVKIGGEWIEIRDGNDLENIGAEAESAGHDAVIANGLRWGSSVDEEVLVFNKKSIHPMKTAAFPDHPDDVVVSKKNHILGGPEILELDVYSYYTDGVVTEMLKEFQGRDLFIGIRLKDQTGPKPMYIRHPYDRKTEYIRIGSEKEFEKFHSGRTVEFHCTMGSITNMYVVDFDAVEDWPTTKKITAEIASMLDKLPEVKKVEIRYSGKRGFHVLGILKKPVPIDKAREALKEHLKEAFGDRDDLVLGESPSGSKGALGVSPMKLNGGQVALWSMRVTGLCCVEVPKAELAGFKQEDARPEKVYKKLTGKALVPAKKKEAMNRVVQAFLKDRKANHMLISSLIRTIANSWLKLAKMKAGQKVLLTLYGLNQEPVPGVIENVDSPIRCTVKIKDNVLPSWGPRLIKKVLYYDKKPNFNTLPVYVDKICWPNV